MRRASAEAIARLEPLLARVRALSDLAERKPGTFYRGASAFLHFHEDAAGDFADLKVAGGWERARVSTRREQAALLKRARTVLAG